MHSSALYSLNISPDDRFPIYLYYFLLYYIVPDSIILLRNSNKLQVKRLKLIPTLDQYMYIDFAAPNFLLKYIIGFQELGLSYL